MTLFTGALERSLEAMAAGGEVPPASGLIRVTVARKTIEAEGIAGFELRAEDGGLLPPFAPGAHIDMHLGGELIRQYSLHSLSRDGDCYRIAVLREPASRGGSVAMHENIREGSRLWISPPRNLFPLTDAGPVLLVAGGIGVTPILAMAESLDAARRPFSLHYCARSPGRMAFRDRIALSAFADLTCLYFDDGPDTQRLDMPAILATQTDDTHMFVCGPGGFMDHVIAAARAAGWDNERIHVEYFAPKAAAAEAGAFEVRIASSGAILHVPADRSVVDVLKQYGIIIPTSCRNGVCGTCTTGVLEGKCDHRDSFLTADEQAAHNLFTPCCSRAATPLLVLDL